MGHQIIKQPCGTGYAVFSSIVDGFTMVDATREEIAGYFSEQERERIFKSVAEKCDALDRGEKPYAQFTLTYDDAVALHQENFPDETLPGARR